MKNFKPVKRELFEGELELMSLEHELYLVITRHWDIPPVEGKEYPLDEDQIMEIELLEQEIRDVKEFANC